MNIPQKLKYTTEHEWIEIDGDSAIIGITDFAQSELGDIVYLELPEVDQKLNAEDECGIVESVKTVSNIYSPLSGIVTAINESLVDSPETINENAYSNWLFKIKISENKEIKNLLSAEDYKKHLNG